MSTEIAENSNCRKTPRHKTPHSFPQYEDLKQKQKFFFPFLKQKFFKINQNSNIPPQIIFLNITTYKRITVIEIRTSYMQANLHIIERGAGNHQ